jgi:hypothetical protein
MLNDKLRLYHEKKNEAVAIFGMSAAKVADHIIKQCFPETVNAAEREGCGYMLRSGLIQQLTNDFKHTSPIDKHQFEFDFPEKIRSIIGKLKGESHYVPSEALWIRNQDLFDNPEWLDGARRFKRDKGNEVLAEADVLDEIYFALYGDE